MTRGTMLTAGQAVRHERDHGTGFGPPGPRTSSRSAGLWLRPSGTRGGRQGPCHCRGAGPWRKRRGGKPPGAPTSCSLRSPARAHAASGGSASWSPRMAWASWKSMFLHGHPNRAAEDPAKRAVLWPTALLPLLCGFLKGQASRGTTCMKSSMPTTAARAEQLPAARHRAARRRAADKGERAPQAANAVEAAARARPPPHLPTASCS